jgi:carboxymethylenebutenolidase
MGEFTRLMARDGHEFDAWLCAPPPGAPRGALVILQEIFGVNSHIRAVADGFAAEGYVTIAPSLFDRAKRGVSLGYTAEDVQLGRGYMLQLDNRQVMLDIAACIAVVRHAGPVAAVGYCWGGTLAYLAACELRLAAAVAYYGTRIAENLQRHPQVPVLYHFGELDKSIPPESIERIRAADPGGEFHVYPADHGFNCDQRAAFDAPAAKLARERTLQFLAARFTGD